MKRVVVFPLLLAASLALLACSEKPGSAGSQLTLPALSSPFQNTDVTGLDFAGDFVLTDHTGKRRTLADFKGKAVVVFFGYTHCPDVCPTTMAEMAAVMQDLGPLADRVQVLFISLDPERDTPQLLAQYVPAFDSRFLGLIGDRAATDKAAKDFKVFYQKVPGKTAGSYTIDHTAGSYVFDPQGRVRLFIRHGQGAAPIAHDLRLLLADNRQK
jgi:protein SCO1